MGGLRSFAETESAFTTRDDGTETVALRRDVLFEFDEAEETVREAATALVRDGAYVLGTVSLTNTGEAPVRPDLVGDDLPGAPDNFTSGSLGGFQLVEPESGITRYVTFVDLGEFGGDFAEEVDRVDPGDTRTLAAVFPAPPQEVDEVTLRAGSFGDIPSVPLQ